MPKILIWVKGRTTMYPLTKARVTVHPGHSKVICACGWSAFFYSFPEAVKWGNQHVYLVHRLVKQW